MKRSIGLSKSRFPVLSAVSSGDPVVAERSKWPLRVGLLVLCVLLSFHEAVQCTGEPTGFAYSSGKAHFAVRYKDEGSEWKVNGVFVLPEELLSILVIDPESMCQYSLEVSSGTIVEAVGRRWVWKLPREVGLYVGNIVSLPEPDTVTLNVFVMVPFESLSGEYLDDYRIGEYPEIPYMQLETYEPPPGFVRVTRENEETLLGPHFVLGQFVGNQQPDTYPKYIFLKERLVLKLEHVLEAVNREGYEASTFNILSGFRTPYHNAVIGNVKYSRHVYGGAADIFIDEDPKDDIMDDLNRDGTIDYRDAGIIYDIIDEMYGSPWYEPFAGGLGRYRRTTSHGPFVHVDVRGFRVRWCD
jgi:hypothetical protein